MQTNSNPTNTTVANNVIDTEALYRSLGQVTTYDPSSPNVITFSRVKDPCGDIALYLTNMAGNYPFEFAGRTWRSSEHLYLCGEFSNNTEIHLEAQTDIAGRCSGYAAKRFGKGKRRKEVREDFETFRIQ